MLWKKESIRNDSPLVDILAKCDGHKFFRILDKIGDSKKVLEKNAKLSKHYRFKAACQLELKNYLEAIELLNEALCFAKNDSEDLGYAYVKRSLCFFNLKMYDKCLTDIKLAKSNNCPLVWEANIIKLQDSCKKMLKVSTDTQYDSHFESKLSLKVNEQCPCIANVIQIEGKEKLGQCITATRDIDVGQTIMVEEGFVWSSNENYRRCCVCMKTTTNLVPCKNCTDSLMCHGICEKDQLHEIECDMALQIINDAKINFHLLVRSILMALRTIPNVNELIRFVERVVSGENHVAIKSVSTSLSRYAVFLENGTKWQWPKKESKSDYE